MSSATEFKTSLMRCFKSSTSFTLVAYTVSLTYPQTKTSSGVMSGECEGQGIGPPRPIQRSGNVSFKNCRTKRLQWGGAPSCWKIIYCWLQGCYLWHSKDLQHIQVIVTSDCILLKEKRSNNLILQKTAPNIYSTLFLQHYGVPSIITMWCKNRKSQNT